MTRIDHDEVAREHLDALSGWGSRDELTASDILVHGTYAQANAVLALKYVVEDLVEQQRIANLIALSQAQDEWGTEAAAAKEAVFGHELQDDGTYEPVVRPDIAAALGIEDAS